MASPTDSWDLPPQTYTDPFSPEPPPRQRRGLHLTLLLLTLASTTTIGGCHYFFFALGFGASDVPDVQQRLSTAMTSQPSFYLSGLWYSLTVLAILGCHEMGHYVACLRYRVDASLPYFLPAPLISGTFGAFIRIRSRIPSKIALFDIGIAGPLAGFVVAVPALFLGLSMSVVERLPDHPTGGWELGEPLLFRLAAWMVWGNIADGYGINIHPVAFAAWFGLLATALNLFPVAQLDGGHITYAVLGQRSVVVTLITIAVAVGLTFVSTNWIVWTVLMLVMLAVIGPRHPPTLNDEVALGNTRIMLAVLALIILVVCFTPVPIQEFVTGAR